MYSAWVMFPGARIQLFTEDKLMIGERHWLNDCYINFVQAVLRVQSPKCDGVKNTLLQNQVRLTIANKIVRILYIHNNHWVVISNVHCSGNDLSMYDTIYDDICTSAMALVSSMCEENVKCQHCAISTEAAGRCGLWCIQYCHYMVYLLVRINNHYYVPMLLSL